MCTLYRDNQKTRVSTEIPGYGLRTEMIRKFFPFPLWKWFRKTGIPERFFFRKTEISGTLFRTYRSLRNSGTFRKFPARSGISFRKIVPEIVKEFRFSGTISIMEMEKIYGSFPYVNRNPVIRWKPY